MTDVFFEELTTELRNCIYKKDHSFRYATLATIGKKSIARLRTVVLRHVSEDLQLTIYTDSRTKKIAHIKENNQVSLLLYHPEKLLQLKIEGTAQIVTDEKRLNTYWNIVQSNSRKEYSADISPGSEIKTPDQVEYMKENHYFAMIDILPKTIEYLKLKRPNHIRVLFEKDNSGWESTFLVP